MSDDPLRRALESALGAQYDVGRLLGRGGAGAVYLAMERLLERPVAIKVLHRGSDDDASRQRFLREARTAAKLSHPNIVALLSFGELGDTLFYIMPYVDGESLEERLRRERRLDPSDARRILGDVASALGYAHQHGVIHRDVKPDNVLIERESGRALLTDFGIARRQAEGHAMTHTGMIVGTPHYMSPEQASGESVVDGRADLYALGVIGYRMLSGRLPFEGRTIEEVLARRFTTDAPVLTTVVADLPIDLVAAVGRCLEREPGARWPDAASLGFAIGNADAGVDQLPDKLESLARFGTRSLGVLYLISFVSTVAYVFDYDPVWFEFLGMVAIAYGVALAVMIGRGRRVGLSGARAMRLAFLEPATWSTWWPRALRSRGSVWDRLPPPVRKARAMVGVFSAGWGALGSGALLGALIARHHHPLSRVLIDLSIASIVGAGGAMIAALTMTKRFGRAAGLDGYEINKLLQEPTSGSKFWSRPTIARLLVPSRQMAARTAGPRSAGEYAREVEKLIARGVTGAHDVAEQAGRVLRDLATRVAAADEELRQLAAHQDPGEGQRLEERLARMGVPGPNESPAIAQMRQLVSSQLTLAQQFGDRQAALRERRQLLEEQARTLWLHVLRFADEALRPAVDGEGSTDEIRRLCDSIERRIEAAIDVRRLTEGEKVS